MDFLSMSGAFPYTTYYDNEMGRGIRRQTAGFLNLVAPESLPDIKLRTNEIETSLLRDGKRQVNIDPGLLSPERFVLATGKNFTHRVYLRDGIYADLTLIYQKGAYRPLPWTYPDYREPRVPALPGGSEKEAQVSAGRDFAAMIEQADFRGLFPIHLFGKHHRVKS